LGPALTDHQIELYSRQIILRELGGTGQARLLGTRCLVSGSGPAFSAALTYLAASGIGAIDILGDGDAAGLPFAPPERINPDSRVRPLARGTGAPPVALEAYDLCLELPGWQEAAGGAVQALERRMTGSARRGSISLRTEGGAGLALILIPAGAAGCPACTRAAPARPPDPPQTPGLPGARAALGRDEPGPIDFALGGAMAAIAACRWLAGIASDGAPRALVLTARAATWCELPTERSLPCPRGCPG
jgi:hypothetical protein